VSKQQQQQSGADDAALQDDDWMEQVQQTVLQGRYLRYNTGYRQQEKQINVVSACDTRMTKNKQGTPSMSC
jgi:hypothetical protein